MSVAAPRGMRDFLPDQVMLRDWASSVILETYKRYGFSRIETPVMESIQLLRGGEGGENLQLIYEVLKRGEKLDKVLELQDKAGIDRNELSDLGLRFDLTVPLVRYYASNQSALPHPLKAIQIGSVFRAESPQKGRFRQFTQCDIDIIGVKQEIAEMELLTATSAALLELGFENFTILINDRRFLSRLADFCGFPEAKKSSVYIALDKLEKIGLEKVLAELKEHFNETDALNRLEKLLSTYLQEQAKGELGITELESLFSGCFDSEFIDPLKNVLQALESNSQSKYKIKFDPTLVRGMGYYTGQIFEAKYPGYSGSIAGGGRYDKMVGKFSGREVPACGFSIGFERIIDILTERGIQAPSKSSKIALLVDPDRDSGAEILEAASRLQENGSIVSIQARKKDLKKQLDSFLAQGFTQYCPFKGDLNSLELKKLEAK